MHMLVQAVRNNLSVEIVLVMLCAGLVLALVTGPAVLKTKMPNFSRHHWWPAMALWWVAISAFMLAARVLSELIVVGPAVG